MNLLDSKIKHFFSNTCKPFRKSFQPRNPRKSLRTAIPCKVDHLDTEDLLKDLSQAKLKITRWNKSEGIQRLARRGNGAFISRMHEILASFIKIIDRILILTEL